MYELLESVADRIKRNLFFKLITICNLAAPQCLGKNNVMIPLLSVPGYQWTDNSCFSLCISLFWFIMIPRHQLIVSF